MTVYEFLEMMNQDHIKHQSSVYSPFVYDIPNDSNGHSLIFRPINNVFHRKSKKNPEEEIVFFGFRYDESEGNPKIPDICSKDKAISVQEIISKLLELINDNTSIIQSKIYLDTREVCELSAVESVIRSTVDNEKKMYFVNLMYNQ